MVSLFLGFYDPKIRDLIVGNSVADIVNTLKRILLLFKVFPWSKSQEICISQDENRFYL